MIRSLRHRGLRRLHERGYASGVNAAHVGGIARVLSYLDVARMPRDIDYPGLRLHPLTGNLRGYWSVLISGNWRIIFWVEGNHVTDVDLVGYH